MGLTGVFVLPADAVLQPALELGDEFRRRSGSEDGDCALSRRNSRTHTKLVDGDAAELIRQFERPSTIALAVARFSRSRGSDPERTLEEALPWLRALIEEGLLVGASDMPAASASDTLPLSSKMQGWVVARCIQTLEDTELYEVKRAPGVWGALKIGRRGVAAARQSLSREARILSGIVSARVPRLLEMGDWQDRPYLITEWFAGVDAQSAAAAIRREDGPEERHALLKLGASILDAYADLHENGLVHGDIHPRNLLVDKQGSVKILDFGLANFEAETVDAGRGGISFFFEPEFARAVLQDLPPPPASFAGEQYGVAALLYLLLTGSHYQDFSLERRRLFDQIAIGAMTPFTERGIKPWPKVEKLLAQALSKDHAARFRSLREFAQLWCEVEVPVTATPHSLPDARLGMLQQEVLRKSAIGGPWMREGFAAAPRVVANSGYSGLAYGLYRMACALDDGELLAVADAWSARAVREIGSEAAFDRLSDYPTQAVGQASLYYQRPGVYAAEAMIAAARGDIVVHSGATAEFVAWGNQALGEPRAKIDLTLGLAGSLLGAALLLESFFAGQGPPGAEAKARVDAFGRKLYAQLWEVVEDYAPVGEVPGLSDIGLAHGWAGILYASLCWCGAAGTAIPSPLRGRLEELAARAQPFGRGLQWLGGSRGPVPGWCNGSAGLVFLWTEAHRALGGSSYLGLAEGASWSTWETPNRYPGLCCGFAGQAYALLNFYRYSGDSLWLRRATTLANRSAAAASSLNPDHVDAPDIRAESLYNGIVGIAVLAADLDKPQDARMPFFERE